MSTQTVHSTADIILPQTRRLWEHAQQVLIGGGQAHRRPAKYVARNCPAFATHGKGAYFWDVDGRRYLDYLCGYGPIILGHADEEVNAAVIEQLSRGTIFSLEHPEVLSFVEELCQQIPCAQLGTLLVGGSSTTLAAVRCARAYTRRELVVRCGYHGWFDWAMPNDVGSPPSQAHLTLETPFNDVQKLEEVFAKHGDKIAVLILEGVNEVTPSPEFVTATRRVCDRSGAVLILDEVKTGFRVHPGGAQALYGYQPDLATFGKAMGNGFAISALLGRREILQKTADVFIGATFHGELLGIAAARATRRAMQQRDGYGHIRRMGQRLMAGLDKVFEQTGYPAMLVGDATMPMLLRTPAGHARPVPPAWNEFVLTEWCAAMQRRGFFMTGHVWFITASHTPADIDATIAAGGDAALEAVDVLRRASQAGVA
jgi:glutamate-1-semialdehyde aminotransferase